MSDRSDRHHAIMRLTIYLLLIYWKRDTLPVTFQPAGRQQPACRHAAAARQASASQAPSSWSRRVASRKKERVGDPAGVDDSNPQS